MNDKTVASVARLEQQIQAGTLSYATLDKEINVLESLLKDGSSCISVTQSVPRGAGSSGSGKRPTPEEAMERTLRTHRYQRTPDAGSNSAPPERTNYQKLATLVASLKLARDQRPLDTNAVRQALRASR